LFGSTKRTTPFVLLGATVLLFTWSTTALAGCTTKDDCKFDRLCVDGQCVAPPADSRKRLPQAGTDGTFREPPAKQVNPSGPPDADSAVAGTASAGCQKNADCKFDRHCVNGVCISPAVASTVAAPGNAPDAPITPSDDTMTEGRGTTFMTALLGLLIDVFYDGALWVVVLLVVLRVLRKRDERRYLFADFEGDRLLHVALVALEEGEGLAGQPLVSGDLIARLHGLERRFASGKAPSRTSLPAALGRLVAHPRFAEIEGLATRSGGSDAPFAKTRQELSA
jgi:hypothetical protein